MANVLHREAKVRQFFLGVLLKDAILSAYNARSDDSVAQTDKTIALPLAHARGNKEEE